MDKKLHLLNRAFIKHNPKEIKCAFDINDGNCFRWAYIAQSLYGGQIYSFINDWLMHVFIKIDGKFYDAERPQGVEDWRQLPFFECPKYVGKDLPQELDHDQLKQIWFDPKKDSSVPKVKKIVEKMMEMR